MRKKQATGMLSQVLETFCGYRTFDVVSNVCTSHANYESTFCG